LFHQRLITLLDMQRYPADLLIHIMWRLDYLKENAVHHREQPNKLWPDAERKRIHDGLLEALPWLDKLSLGMTRHGCEQLAKDILHLDIRASMAATDSVIRTLELELKQRVFFVLSPDNVRHFDNSLPAGEQVKAKFGNANTELSEAGNCFALARYKACVVHCCLACESGLAALAKRLRIPKQTDWGSYLREIRKELAKRFGRRKNRDRIFYAECAERFDAIRVARRNPVSHFGLDSYYTEGEAKEILDATCAFFRHLATKLKE
jgi:hypothetical protein